MTVYKQSVIEQTGQITRRISDYEALAEQIEAIPGVTRAAPLVKQQVMANFGNQNAGIEIYGISEEDLQGIPRITAPRESMGQLERFSEGIALGSVAARDLGVTVGDTIRVISPNGASTAMGRTPRTNAYEVVYIFTAGRYDIDKTRAYLPIEDAQLFFNKDFVADEIEVMVAKPDDIEELNEPLLRVVGDGALLWTWRDSAGAFLRALAIEDNVMFLIMSILVLVASMLIIAGLVMLVSNKGRDVGVLRTMGLTEGSVLRIFFICGAGIGTVGTILGVIFGVFFVLNIDTIFSFVNYVSGGGVWDPSIRGIYELPAELNGVDILKAVALALGTSWTITFFPARRAARMNPVEALRYE